MGAIGLLLCFITPIFPIVWMAPDIEGFVVDQAGRPIGGATVTASWMLTGMEDFPVKYIALEEAPTDSHGRFYIPSWGPRFHFDQGRLLASEPQLRVVASGYVPEARVSQQSGGNAGMYARFRSGTTVSLNPISSATEYEAGFHEYLRDFYAGVGSGCEREIPNTIAAIRAGLGILQREGLADRLPVPSLNRPTCGSPRVVQERGS